MSSNIIYYIYLLIFFSYVSVITSFFNLLQWFLYKGDVNSCASSQYKISINTAQKMKFSIKVSSVNVTKSAVFAVLVTCTEEILNNNVIFCAVYFIYFKFTPAFL